MGHRSVQGPDGGAGIPRACSVQYRLLTDSVGQLLAQVLSKAPPWACCGPLSFLGNYSLGDHCSRAEGTTTAAANPRIPREL